MPSSVQQRRVRKTTCLLKPRPDKQDRRVSIRHHCGTVVACGPISLRRNPPSWSVQVRDISLEGVGLVLNGYVPVGTFLSVHFPDESGNHTPLRALIVRTMRIGRRTWLLGCTLHPGLSEDDLQRLV